MDKFIEKLEPRDVIGAITLGFCFFLISKGINHLVSGITIMIVSYYFAKRRSDNERTNGRSKKRRK